MKISFYILVCLFLMTGCGSSGSNNESVADTNETIHQLSDVVVLKTGQSLSYDEVGNVRSDGSIKDDGYYQAGSMRRYIRDDVDNTVLDLGTGLMWQDDINVSIVQKKFADRLEVTPGIVTYDFNGDNALNYCKNMRLGGYTDWRVPALVEMQSLVDYGKDTPAIDPIFQNIGMWGVWTNEPHESNSLCPTVEIYDSGMTFFGDVAFETSVRCVREHNTSTIDTDRRFERSEDGVITDVVTGRAWSNHESNATTWMNAINECETMIRGGYEDWRLPSFNELNSITNYSECLATGSDSCAYSEFDYIDSGGSLYWSATTDLTLPTQAWIVDFSYPVNLPWDKVMGNHHVICVRTLDGTGF